MSDQALNSGDSAELEALFDSIVQAQHEDDPPASGTPGTTAQAATPARSGSVEELSEPARTMFSQIGQLTRKLHDTLRELGLDKSLEQAVSQIPDARDRLSYVATMTEQAAERTLNALDAARPLQDQIANGSRALSADWDKLFANQLSVEEFKALVQRTRQHLKTSVEQSDQINSQMLEIMMAQDFQDLTGQVIKKVLLMAKDMESQLLEFLLAFSPQGTRHDDGLLAGPVINAEGRTDVVTSQEQVDDLLESLGF
ncbi:protein phosphatase CheZ [Chitiniphilus purpureus]|uniref:Protein phosphatase CheZ n=1 Tax=Chitiniphilus purpureus TaxID=2981137 RepID=A0ABY6DJR5_9NEIS|nr:protein phosphatase CheZ [Chitiniphilus sp. CD1]UXY14602.1 protein phosphatase CheZ [Chitiniphilus sp. CD1]